ncbi:MAG: DNA polymerase III subunit chi [Rhodospirillales bacterium]|nr:DNA polymerase III subunit chi [Rhodospirillales bacterium]
MVQIAFYHLQRSPLEQVLPRLLEKTLDAGKRAVVIAGSNPRVESLNAVLWTYDQDSWLPHGSEKDGRADEQPIWLTTGNDNPNGATFLFQTEGCEGPVGDYERCFDLFDGNDPAAVEAARVRWKAYKDQGHDLTYWQQTDRGGWEQKG